MPYGDNPVPFIHISVVNNHPFRLKENLICLVAAHGLNTTKCKGINMIDICVKIQIDDDR